MPRPSLVLEGEIGERTARALAEPDDSDASSSESMDCWDSHQELYSNVGGIYMNYPSPPSRNNLDDASYTLGDGGGSPGGGEDADEGEQYPEDNYRAEVQHPDVTATLDAPEDEVDLDADVDVGDGLYLRGIHDAPAGIQQRLLWAVFNRLKGELMPSNHQRRGQTSYSDKWLLRRLRKNGWWIRRHEAPEVAGLLDKEHKLRLGKHHVGYYCDIFVWIPDIRWGEKAMPCCPNCHSNHHVRNWGWHNHHFGRKVVGLKRNYFMISKRYICQSCQRISDDLSKQISALKSKKDAAALERILALEKEKAEKVHQYTHMGWNPTSVELLPFGWGGEFPAFMTRKGAVDRDIVDMMRPMSNKGYRLEAFSDLLLELHTKEYTRSAIRYEYDIVEERETPTIDNPNNVETGVMFSAFDDRERYNGQVPTGQYLSSVRRQHHETIELHLDREVKKIPIQSFAWDASYKASGNLMNFSGQPVFKGLISALDSIGRVRVSFFVTSDAHDQSDAALEAFNNTTSEYGQPSPTILFTDNPAGDDAHFKCKIPGLRMQQEKYDALVADDGSSTRPDAPTVDSDYPFDPKWVQIAEDAQDIDAKMAAMRDNLGAGKVIGFDTETKVNSRGGRCPRPTGGRSRVGLLQFGYKNDQGEKQVLLVRLSKIGKVPASVIGLFNDHTITLAGNNIGGDLKGLSNDYPEVAATIANRGDRNVVSLGVYARRRDVVQNGTVGLKLLVKRLLNVNLRKEDRDIFSDWDQNVLTREQIAYASRDALAHLEVYEKLVAMPDLNLRLKKEHAKDGVKVDIVPRSSSYHDVSAMATRAATGFIVDLKTVTSPLDIDPPRFKRGKATVAVEITDVLAPSFIVPKYKVKSTGEAATLADIGTSIVIVPVTMLKEHIQSDQIRVTPAVSAPNPASASRTKPAANATIAEVATKPTANVPNQLRVDDNDDDFYEVEPIEDISTAEIEMIRAASVSADRMSNGKVPLRHPKLGQPPSPSSIKDRYSSVLGDPFHAIDRPKVPMHHEHKKGYKVALQNAFYEWNPVKMKRLEERMRADGMTPEQIEYERYFNSALYKGCIDRRIPPPRKLYWRVRAVFVMYGGLKDTRSRTLFNDEAWTKARNLLGEILRGYYSDPPDLQLYSKRMNPDGSVMKNKYGMELIECWRGTNRVEAYHKNLNVTFGGWHVGIAMSMVLLAENRHRHNQRCTERRIDGFPRLGHYDTWYVDLLQRLVHMNHGIVLYPNWTNASDFKDTPESFDTVALHSSELHAALESKCARINMEKVNLSGEQRALCRAQGVQLPFLPFTTEEEKKKFSRYYSTISTKTDEEASVWWCNHVDGDTIFPKLPFHFRTRKKDWLKSRRAGDMMKAAQTGVDTLNQLNSAVSIYSDSPRESATATVMEHPNATEIPRPQLMPQPNEQALHNNSHVIVGGTMVTLNLGGDSDTLARASAKQIRGRDSKKRKTPQCGLCYDNKMYEMPSHDCPGFRKRSRCDYFDTDGLRRCWRCCNFGTDIDPYSCPSTRGHRDDCIFFGPPDKRGKCKRK